jgi:transcriptional regulator with XRE-family HTH domain
MSALPAAGLHPDKPILLPVGCDLVRRAMQARGLTVTMLAAGAGISRKHLSNILNGHAPLVEPLLGRLAKATGIDPVLLRATVRARPKGPLARYGAMRGTIEVLCDPTEPMAHWEMLED